MLFKNKLHLPAKSDLVEKAVLYLRHNSNTPDKLKMIINTPGGHLTYDVPILKVKLYDIDTIFQKKLLILIPFYIFTFEKQLPKIEQSKEKTEELKGIYGDILSRLNKMCESGELDEYTKKAICDMAEKVINSLTKEYETVRKEVTAVMGGKVLEYEAKTILRDGIKQGMERGIEQGIKQGMERGIELKYTL